MINLIDSLFFALATFTVSYLLIYAIAGMVKQKEASAKVSIKHRFAIIVPTYKDDEYIIQTVQSLLQQEYPVDCYEIVVVADHLKERTLERLAHFSITLLKGNFKTHTKTRAIKAAMHALPDNMYDIALILNADNTTAPDFLEKINNSFSNGSNAIQCHRLKKEITGSIATLEAISDEIENSIFRAGHTMLNLSSTLNGSGMAFEYNWFKQNINEVGNYEDEKKIEALLLRDCIYIDYLDYALVYTVKRGEKKRYFHQRKVWIKMHYHSLFKNIGNLIPSLFQGNFDYANRILQWITIPRHILFGVVFFFGITLCFIDWTLSIKWWVLYLTYIFSLSVATPNYLVDEKFDKAIKRYPLLFIQMLLYFLMPTKKIKR
ncbi:MAG: glycosyltransferase [Phocaeicola sp.]